MIIKDSGRRLLKSDIIITQTTQGQKRLLVDEGDFTSLNMSALKFPHMSMTMTTTASPLPAFLAHFSHFRL